MIEALRLERFRQIPAFRDHIEGAEVPELMVGVEMSERGMVEFMAADFEIPFGAI